MILFIKGIGVTRTITFFFDYSVYSFLFLFEVILVLSLAALLLIFVNSHSDDTYKRYSNVQMRFWCTILNVLVLDDDVPDYWNLCLFIGLSWTLCY